MMLDLVVHAREALQNEVSGAIAQRKEYIDSDWLKRFKELASTFNSLTDARIRLDKSERSLENDLSPEEEKHAVIDFFKALEPQERGETLGKLVRFHNENLSPKSPPSRRWTMEEIKLPDGTVPSGE